MNVFSIHRSALHRGRRSTSAIGLVIALASLYSQGAHASLSCSATGTDINFTNVVPWEASGSLTGSITVTCRNSSWTDLSQNVNVCLSIGTGANSSSWDPRRLFLNGSTTKYLEFQFYQPDGTIFGSSFNPKPYMLSMYVPGGVSSRQQVVNVRTTLPSQRDALIIQRGTYTGNFQGGHTLLAFTSSWLGNPTDCSNQQTSNGTFGFNVTANVADYCSISAINPMSFASVAGFGDTERLASTQIGLRCTLDTPYKVNLTPSNNNGNGQGALKRTTGGSETVAYSLYSNPARTTPWGNQVSNNVAKTGTGQPDSIPVYGRVPANLDATPGDYSDSVQVTVTY
ncbi:spore coat U domain-containing protein [Diaphorobacter sp. HDW4A]|uniref:Csu type fimbrial protein n=1 Tax=Diaphorobacter sp. HDW4A TaxID=2714924 RepID=UPI0014074E91|nr:spore coat protein U domain-containing protein [Diaphorobacter sp. HDW4A]QIL81967.1 spore coat U domain-containing protein [Diaphorobacter sp. HDW4A]